MSVYTKGQRVLVRPYGCIEWRNAIVMEPSPYRNRHGQVTTDGARCSYDPPPSIDPVTRVMPSSGGWFPANSIRPREMLLSVHACDGEGCIVCRLERRSVG